MISQLSNHNVLSFKGTNKEDDFSNIAEIFRPRDIERAVSVQNRRLNELHKEADEFIGTTSKSSKPSRANAAQHHKRPSGADNRHHTQPAARRTVKRNDDGDMVEYTTKTAPKGRKQHKPKIAPYALAASLLLTALGVHACQEQGKTDAAPTAEPMIQETTGFNWYDNLSDYSKYESEIGNYTYEDVLMAVREIESDKTLSNVFYDLIAAKNNMEETIGDPKVVLGELLEQDYADGIEMELVLPQIFVESSGNHYDSEGNVLESHAQCNGFMQLSEGAQSDMNNKYFSDEPLDRNDPIDNLKLGIAYDSTLLNDYFDGDMFKAIAAYNCGPGNVENGNYYGADEYANKILSYYDVLKRNPQFTQMLIDGALDEYQNRFC